MIALNETIEKMNALDEEKAVIVVNLVDYLSRMQNENKSETNPFRKAWEEGRKNPMTEEEADAFVKSIRKERHAGRN